MFSMHFYYLRFKIIKHKTIGVKRESSTNHAQVDKTVWNAIAVLCDSIYYVAFSGVCVIPTQLVGLPYLYIGQITTVRIINKQY